jgi:hypothetical protein
MRHTRGVSSPRCTAAGPAHAAISIVLVLLATAVVPARAGQEVAQAPALSRSEAARFLETAKIIKGKDISRGVTRPSRLTLSDGTITHDASFSAVDERKSVERFESGKMELDFVDSYKYSLAAYKLAELVGVVDMMPVHVEREWRGHKGALVWWVDDVMMDEGDRLKKKPTVPNPEAWNEQMYRMRVFTQLVADTDRNVGNILIDKNWKLWMIDFTRAFRHNKTLLSDKDLKKIDRQLLEKLRALTAEQVTAATKPYLSAAEIAPLMSRRDVIVAFFEKLVAEKGEAEVLY